MSHQRHAITGSTLSLCLCFLGALAACRTESKDSTPPAPRHEPAASEPAPRDVAEADAGMGAAAAAPSAPDSGRVSTSADESTSATESTSASGVDTPEAEMPVAEETPPAEEAVASSEDASRQADAAVQVQQHIAEAQALLALAKLDEAQAEADAALEIDPRNVRAAELRAQILSKKSSAATVVARPPAESAVTPAPRPASSTPRTGEFGEPLVVNGKEVSENDIRRYLIYGPCREMIEFYRRNLIIDDELTRRAHLAAWEAIEPQVTARAQAEAESAIEGKTFASDEEKQTAWNAAVDAARARAQGSPEIVQAWQEAAAAERARLEETLQPTETEFQSEFHKSIEEFKQNYPVLDVEAEVSRKFRRVDWFKTFLRQTLYFDRVFYPDDPNDWPETTIEAVRADSGEDWIKDAHDSYRMRREHADKTGEPLPKEDPFYTQVMRQIVWDALYKTIDFRTAFEGLPDHLVLTADKNGDGQPEMVVTTAELWERVKDSVTPQEIVDVKQWFVTSIATTDRLRADGALLGEADCNRALAEFNKQFEGTYINIDIMAMLTYYFPSTEAFKEWYCLSEGFKNLMEPRLADSPTGDVAQPLRDYLDKANRILGLGQIELEAMLVAAFDIPKNRWKENGWASARQKAAEIKAEIDANAAAWEEHQAAVAKARAEGGETPATTVEEPYKFWTRMMDTHSEFWDPPPPEKGRSSEIGMHNRGRFGDKYRNDLQGYLGETPYSHWVKGTSLTDTAFFDVPEGVVKGPFKGPLGYYLLRVNRKKPPTYPLNLAEPKKLQLLKDDYLRVAFVDYAREAVEEADVKGFETMP